MSHDLAVSSAASVEGRADCVKGRIDEIKSSLVRTFLELGRLLREARDEGYALFWGYSRFGDWVESSSGLDMSERQAYNLISVVERAEALGIPDEQLLLVKFSKLKAIFALKSADDDVVRELVEKAKTASLKKIESDIAAVKIADGGEPFEYRAFKAPQSVWTLKDRAFDHARDLYGDTVNGMELPDWKCLELSFVSMINEEAQDEGAVDAEFTDVIEVYRSEGIVEA